MDTNLPSNLQDISASIPSESAGKKIIMFGLPECPDCLRIKKFFADNAIEYEYHDVSSEKEASKWLMTFVDHVPVLVMLDQTVLYSPSNQQLLDKINTGSVNQTAQSVEPQIFDTIVIGAGPAGITAAIYAVRKALKVLVLATEFGGQATRSGDVENYPGFTMITGADLASKFKEDLEKFKGDGLWVKEGVKVTGIDGQEGNFLVKTDQNLEYHTKTVIVASGRTPRFLGIPGEKELLGRGVATCATCDGPLFKGKDVAIIGGGNSALDAASYLVKLVKSITIINVTEDIKGDDNLVKTARNSPNIKILNNTSSVEIIGKSFVESIKVKNNSSHEEQNIPVSGIFIEIGWVPSVDFVPQLAKDKQNEITVNEMGETSEPGIWAAGDVNNLWGEQIVIAAGEGAKVALAVSEHIAKLPHGITSNVHES